MESSENIKFLTNTQKDSGTLILTNSVSILDSEHLKKVTLEAFENFQSFDINVEALHSIDLSGIQILYSIFQTAKNLKKKISITGNLPEDLIKDIESAGFNQLNWLYNVE
jgi:anti-anti-sigma regulatory factor